MPEIRVLDSHVADLIAAGEVVERPASVAKELMENAIDAGASKVTVEIAHGGMTFLRVTDDGCGIPAGQLKTAFLRHATSKLRTEYDLEAIGTLGFRGEALAAISAVSRMEVLTRTAEAPLGASLSLEGGVPGNVEETGCPLGTTMVVRDLFFNTPARLKFMKKDAAEGAAVFAVVQRVALSHPEVSVKFIRDGKQELLTPGDGRLQSAVYAVLGRELALGFRAVKATGEDMTVSGFVSLPACCRGSRNWQFFFVNGRQVKSRIMMAALEEAYKNQKMVGKFPGCVLHLETKLNAVDVNVHPAKTEVKFGNERQVFSAVYHAVLSALEQDRSHPEVAIQKPERG
ncbi:DNA mismatch repair endonuclease MutL, partial [Pseudoflavonifractor phocaeensis]|uniref:DNA mismatch repair endonuclease MutL n=1 Tax=Pseudoflavonifractor phocaeensis TaxID=1870988 RepID=UPI001F1D5E68